MSPSHRGVTGAGRHRRWRLGWPTPRRHDRGGHRCAGVLVEGSEGVGDGRVGAVALNVSGDRVAQRPEGVGDLVPVAVGGDGPGDRGPIREARRVGGWGPSRVSQGEPAVRARSRTTSARCSMSASRAANAAAVSGSVTLRAGGISPPIRVAGRARPAGDGGGGPGVDAPVQDRGQVVGVDVGAFGQPRQGRRDRQGVGFGAAQRHRQRPVRGRVLDRADLLGGEPGADEQLVPVARLGRGGRWSRTRRPGCGSTRRSRPRRGRLRAPRSRPRHAPGRSPGRCAR